MSLIPIGQSTLPTGRGLPTINEQFFPQGQGTGLIRHGGGLPGNKKPLWPKWMQDLNDEPSEEQKEEGRLGDDGDQYEQPRPDDWHPHQYEQPGPARPAVAQIIPLDLLASTTPSRSRSGYIQLPGSPDEAKHNDPRDMLTTTTAQKSKSLTVPLLSTKRLILGNVKTTTTAHSGSKLNSKLKSKSVTMMGSSSKGKSVSGTMVKRASVRVHQAKGTTDDSGAKGNAVSGTMVKRASVRVHQAKGTTDDSGEKGRDIPKVQVVDKPYAQITLNDDMTDGAESAPNRLHDRFTKLPAHKRSYSSSSSPGILTDVASDTAPSGNTSGYDTPNDQRIPIPKHSMFTKTPGKSAMKKQRLDQKETKKQRLNQKENVAKHQEQLKEAGNVALKTPVLDFVSLVQGATSDKLTAISKHMNEEVGNKGIRFPAQRPNKKTGNVDGRKKELIRIFKQNRVANGIEDGLDTPDIKSIKNQNKNDYYNPKQMRREVEVMGYSLKKEELMNYDTKKVKKVARTAVKGLTNQDKVGSHIGPNRQTKNDLFLHVSGSKEEIVDRLIAYIKFHEGPNKRHNATGGEAKKAKPKRGTVSNPATVDNVERKLEKEGKEDEEDPEVQVISTKKNKKNKKNKGTPLLPPIPTSSSRQMKPGK